MNVIVLSCPYPTTSLILRDGDIIVVRVPEGSSAQVAEGVLGKVAQELAKYGHEDIHVVVLQGEYDLTIVSDEELLHLGLQRIRRADGSR